MTGFDPNKIKTPERFEYHKPTVAEIMLSSSEEATQYFKIENNQIIFTQEVEKSFESSIILTLVLKGGDIIPVDSKVMTALPVGGTIWHRDPAYPVLGIYKPFGKTRDVPTQFTVSTCTAQSKKNLNPATEAIFENTYEDPTISKLTFFLNRAVSKKDEFLFHRRSNIKNEKANLADIRNDVYSVSHIDSPSWAKSKGSGKNYL